MLRFETIIFHNTILFQFLFIEQVQGRFLEMFLMELILCKLADCCRYDSRYKMKNCQNAKVLLWVSVFPGHSWLV